MHSFTTFHYLEGKGCDSDSEKKGHSFYPNSLELVFGRILLSSAFAG